MAKKSKATKKKTNVKQKQKQRQSINININSNNRKNNTGTSKPKAPIPQYAPPGSHTTTIVGGTGRGSEMLPQAQQSQSNSTDIGNLLKMMVAGGKDFSGVGKLFSKVGELENRQSTLESRLTDEYQIPNDISDNEHVHYNNESRLQASDYGIGREIHSNLFTPMNLVYDPPESVEVPDIRDDISNITDNNEYQENVSIPNSYISDGIEDPLANEPLNIVNDYATKNVHVMQVTNFGTPEKVFNSPKIETGFKPQENIMPQQSEKQNTINDLTIDLNDIDTGIGDKTPHEMVQELKQEEKDEEKELLRKENERLEAIRKQEEELKQIRENKAKEHKIFTNVNTNIDDIISQASKKNIDLNNIKQEYDNALSALENSTHSTLPQARKQANKVILALDLGSMKEERGSKNVHLSTQNKDNSIKRLKEYEGIVKAVVKRNAQLNKPPQAQPAQPAPLSDRMMTINELPETEEKKKKKPVIINNETKQK